VARKHPSKRAAAARRLPTGRYAYRGKAVPFSKLPKRERARFHSKWSAKAAVSARRATRIASEAPLVVGAIRGERWSGWHGDVPAGTTVKRFAGEVAKAAAGTSQGAWFARLRWEPDVPGERPRETVVSLGLRRDWQSMKDREFLPWLQAGQNAGRQGAAAMNLNRDKSGGKGKPKIVEIGLLGAALENAADASEARTVEKGGEKVKRTRTRKLRRSMKARLRHGWKAGPRHRLKAGRTGSVHSRKTRPKPRPGKGKP